MPGTPENKRTRPVFKSGAIDDQVKFQPLPSPVGDYPYHLDIKQILPSIPENKMVFHACGDTGGITLPAYQHIIANEMTRQYNKAASVQERPQFFLHLGDVVYNFGQKAQYYDQFFDPFRHYPAPIFAIAGNHDGDINPADPERPKSLDAFVKVFCGRQPLAISFSGDANFKSNIQPNIYYTIKTPLANIICLYSNVPKFGTITAEQRDWFIEELKNAELERSEKALIICMHHPAYSADTNHGSSLPMQTFLGGVFASAQVFPDLILSGHVHNYQRFSKTYSNGKVVPFIIAGAGGYAQLHSIAEEGDPNFPGDSKLLDDVVLENYCETKHGFLKISLKKAPGQFTLLCEYYTIGDEGQPAVLYDTFKAYLRSC